jgi:hypothetical protein
MLKITIIFILFILSFFSCKEKKEKDTYKKTQLAKYIPESKNTIEMDTISTIIDSGFLENKSLREIFDMKRRYSVIPKLIKQKKNLIEKEIINFDFSLGENSNYALPNLSTKVYYDNDKVVKIQHTYNSNEGEHILNYYFCYGKHFNLVYVENQRSEIENDTTTVMLRGIILKNNITKKLYFLGGDYPIEPTLQASHQVIMILDKFLFPIKQIRKEVGNIVKVSNDFPYFLFQVAYGRNYKYLYETAVPLNIVTSNDTRLKMFFEIFDKEISENQIIADLLVSDKGMPLWFYEGRNHYKVIKK